MWIEIRNQGTRCLGCWFQGNVLLLRNRGISGGNLQNIQLELRGDTGGRETHSSGVMCLQTMAEPKGTNKIDYGQQIEWKAVYKKHPNFIQTQTNDRHWQRVCEDKNREDEVSRMSSKHVRGHREARWEDTSTDIHEFMPEEQITPSRGHRPAGMPFSLILPAVYRNFIYSSASPDHNILVRHRLLDISISLTGVNDNLQRWQRPRWIFNINQNFLESVSLAKESFL